jgi:hypothetical protein
LTDRKDAEGQSRASKIHITVIIQNRYTFETEVVTGKQIKERANIPAGFSLHRRVKGGNEPIRDDESVELHNGDHFFSRPYSRPPSVPGPESSETGLEGRSH